jgi:hypothetical protein
MAGGGRRRFRGFDEVFGDGDGGGSGGGEEGKVGDDWPNGNGERQESRGAARASSRPSRARRL